MAVKQHITELAHDHPHYDISQIIEIIEALQTNPDAIPTNVSGVKAICEKIVMLLARTPAGREAEEIRLIKKEIGKICVFFRELENYTPEHYPEIVRDCLNKLYKHITSENETSNYASAVLVLVDTSKIRPGVQWVLRDVNSPTPIKKIFKTLAAWLETYDFAPDLTIWIVEILRALWDQQKNDLLLELSMDIIESYCKKLAMPFYLPRLAPIVLCILKSIRHTPRVFNLILPKAPKLLKDISKGEQNLLFSFVDVLSALMLHFPANNQHYEELEKCLKLYPRSENFRQSLDIPHWNDTCHKLAVVPSNAKVGLVNLGNTCYMNSVLQALVMTKQFSREILLSKIDEPLFFQIQKLLALLLHSDRPELTPRSLLVAARPPDFVPGYQQDSSEFLGYLLEKLHEQEQKLTTNQYRELNRNSWHPRESHVVLKKAEDSAVDGDESNSQTTETNNERQQLILKTQFDESLLLPTLIQKTFDGKLFVTYQCGECGSKSSNIDTFRSFELSFPEPNGLQSNYSVQKLLDFYCSSEKLFGDNRYYCNKCKRLCDGERSIRITRSPRILILTLKHFRYDQQRHTRAKLMNKVIHDEVISLSLTSETESPVMERYSLYAAVIHAGTSMDSGHYYTYAQDTPNCWYKFNDNYVTKCSVDELHALSSPNTPYILFYQKLDQAAVERISQDGFDMEEDMDEQSFASSLSDIKLPELEDLPQHLREIVNGDNQSYNEEIRKEILQQRSVGTNLFTLSKNHDSDNDDPPPNSCGSNSIGYSNRSVY